MKKYDKNLLLPEGLEAVYLQSGDFNARVFFWKEIYKKYPDNYWSKVFQERMRNASQEEMKRMLDKAFVLEDMFYNVVVNKISLDSQEAIDLMWQFIDHLEFFHKFDDFFYDIFIEFCERDQTIDQVDQEIAKDPQFLKNNPLFGLVSKEYTDVIYNLLKNNRNQVLGQKTDSYNPKMV